ncbi:MAG: recombination regulator RecX [Oscillospiraceae bacterium]|nr:recombination regulator RecX [Oscillospiraceae bacterium]
MVKLENWDVLRVTEEELLHFGLRAGMELDGEALETLRSSARSSAARATAANIIGSRALSKQELTRRLVKKGNDASDAQAAADWLEDIGAVNDVQYAAALARHYGDRGYGPARVREELRRRGVDRELWDEALEELPDPAEILDGLIRKKCRGDLSDRRELKRVSDSLLRRGFGWSDVKAAVGRYTEILEDD